jgi:lipopolysaccharide/colanic/teichoic acid biosynthesis glycosyltransferase
MLILNKKEPIFLFIGDTLFFTISLWVTLLVRYAKIPSQECFLDHLIPFSILFFIWSISFFIAGLYERQALIQKRSFLANIISTQIINSIIAIIFFYFIPVFGLAPKTIIIVYLIISLIAIILWRNYIVPSLGVKKKLNAMIIGRGDEMKNIKKEVNNNPWYNFQFVLNINLDKRTNIDFQKDILNPIYEHNIVTILMDLKDPDLQKTIPYFYNLIFSKIKFLDIHKVYEDIFDRIPVSLIRYHWFLENINSSQRNLYSFFKRTMDILISLPLALMTALICPIIWIAMRIEGKGPLFYIPERTGKNNSIIKLIKFRTMNQTLTDASDWGNGENKVTKVGSFLRRWRIDEFPQSINVLKGDLSLIGPRPEFISAVKKYEEKIPHYGIRHLIKPGLSGWAQIYQKEAPRHSIDIKQTKIKLSYDLFYIKNQSLLIDIKIALKTIKTLLCHSGS